MISTVLISDGVTVSQHARYQEPAVYLIIYSCTIVQAGSLTWLTETLTWKGATVISNTCSFPAMTSPNVRCKKTNKKGLNLTIFNFCLLNVSGSGWVNNCIVRAAQYNAIQYKPLQPLPAVTGMNWHTKYNTYNLNNKEKGGYVDTVYYLCLIF